MNAIHELVSIHKWLICPISALHEKFNPRNINPMPLVKFFVRLDLDQIILFLDGHELMTEHEAVRLTLRILKKIVRYIDETGTIANTDHVAQLFDFFGTFLDRCHHGKDLFSSRKRGLTTLKLERRCP